jgi:hypothetical protein
MFRLTFSFGGLLVSPFKHAGLVVLQLGDFKQLEEQAE